MPSAIFVAPLRGVVQFAIPAWSTTLMLARPIFVLSLLLAFSGCRVTSDVGKQCELKKRDPTDPTGVKAVTLTERELQDYQGDFIFFGATECEDLVCIRDKDAPRNSNLDAAAFGYCSRPCSLNSTRACEVTEATSDTRAMDCRALLLDEQTLSTICQDNAEFCKNVFNSTQSPYYCARLGS
jgi:hypothetical protein